jgi:hypothetical protein
MDRLTDLMELRLGELKPDDDPQQAAWARLEVAGYAYVEFALTESGWFRTAFDACKPDAALGQPIEPGRSSAFRLLGETIDGLVTAGALPPERRPGAEFPAWAAVHGIATLLLDGPLKLLGAEQRRQVVAKVVTSVGTGL